MKLQTECNAWDRLCLFLPGYERDTCSCFMQMLLVYMTCIGYDNIQVSVQHSEIPKTVNVDHE